VAEEANARQDTAELAHLLRWAQLTCAGEVAAIVAHDINNAVTGVLSYTELAQMDLPTWSEAGPYLDKAMEQASRINAQANRLLMLSHEAAPYPALQNVQESLEAVCALLSRRLEKDHITFEYTSDVDGIQIIADAGRLMLIWLGLLLVARSALLRAEDLGRQVRIIARRTVGPSSTCSRIHIEAAAAGVHLVPFLQRLLSADGNLTSSRREEMLCAAARTWLTEMNASLCVQCDKDCLRFIVDLPAVN
jgi:signal transduction histidine kinase